MDRNVDRWVLFDNWSEESIVEFEVDSGVVVDACLRLHVFITLDVILLTPEAGTLAYRCNWFIITSTKQTALCSYVLGRFFFHSR